MEEICDWLVSQIAAELGTDPRQVSVQKPFAQYGLDSVAAVSLISDLEDWLGRELEPTLIWDYPNVESLARYLTGEMDARPTPAPVEGNGHGEREPIAIIGIGCRFPGAANSPAEFWRLLRDGVDAITEVPKGRFDADEFYDPNPAVPGKMNTRWGGFINNVDGFDPLFFGISPREAMRLDPQQRILLEVAWEALEDGGQVPERLAGTPTGVFVGIWGSEYGAEQLNDPDDIDVYVVTGNALSIAANRLSYFFDFRGPSIALDTACSSSLVAVDLACRSLWSGQSTLALAGGANLILSPSVTINFSQGLATSPDGRCRAFDAKANGMVRSEGVGLVVLKPLSRALLDGDPIYAMIRGSAVNQDGRTNGIAAPNQASQEAVLRDAYRMARVSPAQVSYVDAHGTGTLLGDPIEVKALGRVLAEGRPDGDMCSIGSVKSNIGHLEAAAGVAGLIKVALSLKHREIPPSIHFQEPNPHIPFAALPLRVQQALTPWPETSAPAIAGVSAFGFGGTNVHVVLQEPPRESPKGAPNVEEEEDYPYLLPLSGHDARTLRAVAGAYERFLSEDGVATSLRDICYTAGARRTHHPHRLALLGDSAEHLVEQLRALTGPDSALPAPCVRPAR
ncbi:MAG: type I polyketide synthase, partial [Pyrinomonadaceae bacterium]